MKTSRKESFFRTNSVFLVSIIISLIVIGYGAISSDGLVKLSQKLLDFMNDNFAWFYLLALPLILVLLLFLAFSKYGKIRLGDEDSKPEHSTASWFAMLFCAGTGIGLVFWSIAEPLTHYVSPPNGIIPGSEEAAVFSIRTCFLHWGILPWACFTIVGLGIAYFQFRRKKSGLISNIFIPIIGEKRVNGLFGKTIDTFAILVSVAGVATSLGLGCMQICGGTEFLFGIPSNRTTWLIVIAAITLISLSGAITGIDKGIKLLAKINSYLAIALLLLGFMLGPKSTILNTFVTGIGQHIGNFITDCMDINITESNSWVLNWRVFYWAWWVAWAPFVGLFVARISKGRTVKEFIIAVMAVPALLTFVWFSVFGTLALNASGNWSLEELARIAAAPETAVYVVFSTYPLARILSLLIMALLAVFFITSADSATFSLSMLSSNGLENPPASKKIIWGLVEALMAYVLLCSGGLKPLQTISIVAALPFLVIMIFMCISISKALKEDRLSKHNQEN